LRFADFTSSACRHLSPLAAALLVAIAMLMAMASWASALSLGLQWNGNPEQTASEGELEVVQYSGAAYFRVEINRGYGLAFYEPLFERAAKRGITILPYLTEGHRYPVPGADGQYGGWGAWVQDAVKKYGQGGEFWNGKPYAKPVTTWEIWNEPNLAENNPGGEKVQPENYGRFFVFTSSALHGIQPGAQALVGGLYLGHWTEPGMESYVSKLYNVSGMASAVNGVAIHPYGFTSGQQVTEFASEVINIRTVLNRQPQGSSEPLWITELGWPVAESQQQENEFEGRGVDAPTQAKLLQQSFNWAKSNAGTYNLQGLIWHAVSDYSNPKWDYHCGLRKLDGSFRQSWSAFQEQTGAPTWPPPPIPAPPVRVSFADAPNAQSVSTWTWDGVSGWQQYPLWGHRIAAGSSPATLKDGGGSPHVFYVDESYGNTITHWKWNNGWQQEPFFGHTVAAGSSPSAISVGGTLHVFFVDASNNNTITDWKWSSGTGWQQEYFYGHSVAAGTSPSAIVDSSGNPRVYFVDASDNNTITQWKWNSVTGWQQEFFWGLPAAAGSSPSATVDNQGNPRVFFVNATNNNTITDWRWTSGTGWQQQHLWGRPVAAKSSPSAMMVNGALEVFFADASNSNSITVWVWTSSLGWVGQAVLGGHSLATGSSPSAVMNGSTPNVYFVDANNLNSITDWQWNPSSGWQQIFLYGHEVAANSSPSGFAG
jgi:hypothetical protein